MPGPEIVLLSREYIVPEDIHVSADIQAEYTVHVTPQKTGASLPVLLMRAFWVPARLSRMT